MSTPFPPVSTTGKFHPSECYGHGCRCSPEPFEPRSVLPLSGRGLVVFSSWWGGGYNRNPIRFTGLVYEGPDDAGCLGRLLYSCRDFGHHHNDKATASACASQARQAVEAVG